MTFFHFFLSFPSSAYRGNLRGYFFDSVTWGLGDLINLNVLRGFCFQVGNGFQQPLCVRDWSGILLERSGKRYSGKPDGKAGTPKLIYS